MRKRKLERCEKRQRGQFMTPTRLAKDIVRSLDLRNVERILEPSCGNGSFINAILGRLAQDVEEESGDAHSVESPNLVGVEVDSSLLNDCRAEVDGSFHDMSHCTCELIHGDFFRLFMNRRMMEVNGDAKNPLNKKFDLIVGNPPFGGSFPPDIEDELDTLLGSRNGIKIKKESYAFFIMACTELLRPGGRLVFICSDSLLTIPTMMGLRQYLMKSGKVTLHRLDEFSDETNYPMLVLEYSHCEENRTVHRFGHDILETDISATPNLSWGVTTDVAKLFFGPSLGDYLVASSGMTTGKNEYFLREILPDNSIEEPFQFRFDDVPITVEYELERARLNKISKKRLRELSEAERQGDLARRVSIERRDTPVMVSLPNEDYQPYNKASGSIIYCPPTHVIYWKDEGDVVLTYKRTGNWYLRGVGGYPYFGKEGLTWQLVASRFVPRFLPKGYILDSGAPCAFTREGVDSSELYFAIGWLLTPLASHVLKTTINHTMNIQSKDFERMPYPWWVPEVRKAKAIQFVTQMIDEGVSGRNWKRTDPELEELAALYRFDDHRAVADASASRMTEHSKTDRQVQCSLF